MSIDKSQAVQLGPVASMRKTGNEPFHRSGATQGFSVLDFWQWSMADLVSNATRGVLAEFIVAQALGIATTGVSEEWAPYDLRTVQGVPIEVKSAAYLQSWAQRRLSPILFNVSKKRVLNAATNQMVDEPTRTAQVYVFALLAHQDQTTLDPLNLDQWRFYVLSTAKLNERTRSQHSITLPSLAAMNAGPHKFDGLRAAVEAATVQARG